MEDTKKRARMELIVSTIITIIFFMPLIGQNSVNLVAVILFAVSCNFVFVRMDKSYLFVTISSAFTALFYVFILVKYDLFMSTCHIISEEFHIKGLTLIFAVISGYSISKLFHYKGVESLLLIGMFTLFSYSAMLSEVSIAQMVLDFTELKDPPKEIGTCTDYIKDLWK